MPAIRTAAQAEAARRNGRHSRGPATPEGKARASRNALKHGLAAARHLLLEGEDHATYEQLLTDLVQDLAPATELAAQLVRRLAATLWSRSAPTGWRPKSWPISPSTTSPTPPTTTPWSSAPQHPTRPL